MLFVCRVKSDVSVYIVYVGVGGQFRVKQPEVVIYGKPTCTDPTINFLSNHSIEQKMAAIRFHITQMHSLTLDPDKKQKEWKTIKSIAKNINFPQGLLQKLNHQIQSKANHIHNEKKHKIWTMFTYHSPKIRRITNLFKNSDIGIAFKATTTLQQLLSPPLVLEKETLTIWQYLSVNTKFLVFARARVCMCVCVWRKSENECNLKDTPIILLIASFAYKLFS